MNMESGKIKSFRDLHSWQEAHELVLQVYRETEHFPKSEVFGLISQLRRAAVSLTSNIAEGFSRNTYRDKLQFYSIALGSLTEIESQLLIAKDLGYIEQEACGKLDGQIIVVSKLLNGLCKHTRFLV